MFKKLFFFVLALTALTACESPVTEADTPAKEPTKQFTFHVKGNFTITQEEMSRAGDTPLSRAATRLENGNTAGLTDLWVFDYGSDGKLIQQVHQASTAADFGTVPLTLAYGQHNILFVASKGTTPTLSATVGSASGSLSWAKVLDTFTLAYPLEVTSSSNGNRAPELQRAITGVTVHMKDALPANAKTVDITWHASQQLSLPSLSPVAATEVTQSLTFPSSYIGQTDKEFAVYTLIGDTEQTMTVLLTFRDESNAVISTRTIPNVQVRKNRITTLTGNCFTSSSLNSSWGVSVVDTWLTPTNVNF